MICFHLHNNHVLVRRWSVKCYKPVVQTMLLFHGATSPSGPGSPHYLGLKVTLRHTALGRTPLDQWSVPRGDLYLTTQNTHKRQISMPPAGIEFVIPASKRLKTHSLEWAANAIGQSVLWISLSYNYTANILALLISHIRNKLSHGSVLYTA